MNDQISEFRFQNGNAPMTRLRSERKVKRTTPRPSGRWEIGNLSNGRRSFGMVFMRDD